MYGEIPGSYEHDPCSDEERIEDEVLLGRATLEIDVQLQQLNDTQASCNRALDELDVLLESLRAQRL